MPSKEIKILEFNQFFKSDKVLYVVYTDLESLITRINECKNNPDKSSTTKIGEHIPCRYLMSTLLAFDGIENKESVYRGEDCSEGFVNP